MTDELVTVQERGSQEVLVETISQNMTPQIIYIYIYIQDIHSAVAVSEEYELSWFQRVPSAKASWMYSMNSSIVTNPKALEASSDYCQTMAGHRQRSGSCCDIGLFTNCMDSENEDVVGESLYRGSSCCPHMPAA